MQVHFNSLLASRIATRAAVSICFCLFVFPLLAQSSQKLKERREQLLREIQMTSQALDQTRSREKQTLKELELLDKQVALRQETIQHFRTEIDTLERTIASLTDAAVVAQNATGEALNTYRRLARYRLYLRLQGFQPWLHILAAPGMQVAFQRMFLYDRLSARSREAARVWRAEHQQVEILKAEKLEARKDVDQIMALETQQRAKAELERTERNNLLQQIKKNASALEGDLKKQQAERTKLENTIADMIRKEIAAEEAKAKSKTKTKPADKTAPAKKPGTTPAKAAEIPMTPEGKRISGDFAKQKGKLPWPVERASISRPFGEQQHPDLPRVQINNTGIDLRTTPGAAVKSIFEGTVTGVQWVPGFAYTIIVRHGQYYSVYSNMESVNVKKGDVLKSGIQVGIAAKDAISGAGEIHFEIWNGKNRQNPASWLSNKR